MLQVWNATKFVFLSDDCVGFEVSTPIYKGTGIHLPAEFGLFGLTPPLRRYRSLRSPPSVPQLARPLVRSCHMLVVAYRIQFSNQ